MSNNGATIQKPKDEISSDQLKYNAERLFENFCEAGELPCDVLSLVVAWECKDILLDASNGSNTDSVNTKNSQFLTQQEYDQTPIPQQLHWSYFGACAVSVAYSLGLKGETEAEAKEIFFDPKALFSYIAAYTYKQIEEYRISNTVPEGEFHINEIVTRFDALLLAVIEEYNSRIGKGEKIDNWREVAKLFGDIKVKKKKNNKYPGSL